MGKLEPQLHLQQRQQLQSGDDSDIICRGCSTALSRILRSFSLKCIVVLVLGVAVFLSAMFWVFPSHSRQSSGFDAKDSVKLSATVKANFILQKPISQLIPQIPKLEYDINAEIGVPLAKVVVLSMHKAGASNLTSVVFGFLADPISAPINLVSLSVLRSSLIELFLQQSNLTLTESIFGQPLSFEIFQFPGGVTVVPEQSASIWMMSQILFYFTLPNSIYEIKENLVELKEQLKLGLHLTRKENVYVQVTNNNGSTRDQPVTVKASVLSDLDSLRPQRLKQLAQTITGLPPSNNLGLNNSVFGKVKEISLTSFLNYTLQAPMPGSSPAPSSNAPSPFYPPSPSPGDRNSPPCYSCDTSSPFPNDGHIYSPAPSVDIPSPAPGLHCRTGLSPSPSPSSQTQLNVPAIPPHASTLLPPTRSPRSDISPHLSPLPVSYSSSHGTVNVKGSMSPPVASPSVLPYSSSSMGAYPYKHIGGLSFFSLAVLCFW